MKKNYLFDVDGLLQVLQAIKEGKPVEYRPLEEPDWRDFDPENCDIDTENCKYRIKPREYGKNIGTMPISPEDLQEDRIYLLRSDIDAGTIRGFICVKNNEWRGRKVITLHFSWNSDGVCSMLYVGDSDVDFCCSERSSGFANNIGPNLVTNNFDSVSIYHPSLAQVQMLESKLREIGYEFSNGKMQKIDGNKA